jgi:hypothetical protein
VISLVGKKVRCINALDVFLTVGKIYTVLKERAEFLMVTDDHGSTIAFGMFRFEIVPEEVTLVPPAPSSVPSKPAWQEWRDTMFMGENRCCGGACLRSECTYHRE